LELKRSTFFKFSYAIFFVIICFCLYSIDSNFTWQKNTTSFFGFSTIYERGAWKVYVSKDLKKVRMEFKDDRRQMTQSIILENGKCKLESWEDNQYPNATPVFLEGPEMIRLHKEDLQGLPCNVRKAFNGYLGIDCNP